MSLSDWLSKTSTQVRSEGATALIDSMKNLYSGSWRIFGSRLPIGTNVFEREWDILVLLDGCRIDLMKEVEHEFEYIRNIRKLRSVGSTSREWLAKTFSSRWNTEVGNTVYITANPYTSDILSRDSERKNRSPFNPHNWDSLALEDFCYVDEVWRDAWEDELGTVPPRRVTDRAIQAGRGLKYDRLIIHYMQPHQPFIGEWALSNDVHFKDRNCWTVLQRNEVSMESVWRAYSENLVTVLNDVTLLLQNIDANVVVLSSDHGNAFGEWGVYGHPNGFLHPVVKDVPWIETEAVDTGKYDPAIERNKAGVSIEDRLRDLGYK